MKKTVNIILLSCCFILSSLAQAPGDLDESLWCLEITGRILNASEGGTPCKVELMHGSKIVDSMHLRGARKKFFLMLNKNSQYAIRISKPGYVSRLVAIDTKVPTGEENIFAFSFETSLMPKSEHRPAVEAFDFPIANISFDSNQKEFVHNKDYTESLKQEMSAAGRRQ
jgi:hypothetical protein